MLPWVLPWVLCWVLPRVPIWALLGLLDRVADAGVQIRLARGAWQADADQTLARGEDDAPALVVPGIGLVLAHHRELDAVDGQQFVQGQAEGLGDQDVDLEQRLAAGVVGAQRAVALPVGDEVGEEIGVEQG